MLQAVIKNTVINRTAWENFIIIWLSSTRERVDHVGHVIAVTHIAAVPAIRVNFCSIPEHLTKEVDLPGFENNIVFIVHHGYFGTVAQVLQGIGRRY